MKQKQKSFSVTLMTAQYLEAKNKDMSDFRD